MGSGPPRSSASSESADTGSAAGEAEAAPLGPPKPRANPFGAARPREEVLKEQGRDAVREEQQRRAIDRCACAGHLLGWRRVQMRYAVRKGLQRCVNDAVGFIAKN